MTMIEPPRTAAQASLGFRHGDLRPSEVAETHLDRIDSINSELNAFVLVDTDGARQAAADSNMRWASGKPLSRLDGVPATVKDIVAMAGFPNREGSAVTSNEPCTEDHPVVARMREAGMVILGKTATSEFGWKGITDSPGFGTALNPWNTDHTPGGSSGGAGSSLAAGIGLIAHGSDGGGSIRIPASYCGLVGLKPTFGRVPQHPVDSPFSSLVSHGPIARSVTDAALFLNAISRPDRRDWHASPYDPRDWSVGIGDGVVGLRVGVSTDLGGAVIDSEVEAAIRGAAEWLADLGAQVREMGPIVEPLRSRFEPYWKAGFAARLRTIDPSRHDELDQGFRSLAEQGTDVGLGNYFAGHAERAELTRRFKALHTDVDVLLTPTMPSVAPPADTIYHSPDFDRWDDAVPFTVPFNLTGQPAGSIPVAVHSSGLPIGAQVVGDHWGEDAVLRAMRAIESASGWLWPHPRLATELERLSTS